MRASLASMNELIIILVPNVFGSTGDAVNERQLIKYLCKGRKCILFSFINISKLLKLGEFVGEIYKDYYNGSIMLIPIPLIPPHTIFTLFTSVLIAFIIWILDKIANIRLIYVRSSAHALGVVSIKSLARKTFVKIPAIVEDEILKWRRILSYLYSILDRYILSRAKAIGVPSPLLMKKLLVRRRMFPKGKVILVPAGVDERKIRPHKEILKAYNVKDQYIIGFLGLLAWWQGVDILVKAVAKIKDLLDKPVKFLIVGDGPERRKIEVLCKELNVQCSITGFLRHEDALKLLKTFDVLVVPRRRISSTEAVIPIKIIEAWALGVPVIATAHEVFKYTGLRDREDILFCEPVAYDVADKILMILTDRELRMRVSERGRRIAEHYFYDKIAENILKCFNYSMSDSIYV
jgi:glycosyltransferase involved in cell wall biosynthesis